MIPLLTLPASKYIFIPHGDLSSLHPLDEWIQFARTLERIAGEIDRDRLIMLGEAVQGLEVAIENSREIVSLQIEES